MAKKYQQIENKTQVAKESAVTYVRSQDNVNAKERNDWESAISGKELLNRLRPV